MIRSDESAEGLFRFDVRDDDGTVEVAARVQHDAVSDARTDEDPLHTIARHDFNAVVDDRGSHAARNRADPALWPHRPTPERVIVRLSRIRLAVLGKGPMK